MPWVTEIERRNRALVAFTLPMAARDSAIASMKLKHVDLASGSVYQDAREVETKFSKTFTTFFFPVGEEIREIVADWVNYLRQIKLWGNDDPLFSATEMALNAARQFEAAGLKRGVTLRPSVRPFARHFRLLAYHISIRTAYGKRWSNMVKHVASHRKNSRPGARIWGMRRF